MHLDQHSDSSVQLSLCILNSSSAANFSDFATQVSGVLLKASSPGVLLLENFGSVLQCGVGQWLLDWDSASLFVCCVTPNAT